MFKLILHYQSDEKGIYTTMIKTAPECLTSIVAHTMVTEWFHKLCPHINFSEYASEIQRSTHCVDYNFHYKFDKNNKLKLEFIQSHLDYLNQLNKDKIDNGIEQERKFEFSIEEIEN